MADRVAWAVGDGPKRRIGFGTGLALLIAALVMLGSGVFTSTPAARTIHHPDRA
jgi:hypothetical protein